MDQLPSNSHKSREEAAAPEPTKVEKLVVGEVVMQKKPWHKRVTESFFSGRADVAAEYVVQDVLLPSARDALFNMGTTFLDSVINGNARLRNINNRVIPGQSVGQYVTTQMVTNYNNIGKNIPGAPQQAPGMTPQDRARHDFGRLKFASRAEAEAVISGLLFRIQEYNAVTVSDLYEMCGITANYTDDKFGWQDIRGAGVVPARGGGFVLELPSPVVLD